MERYLTSCTCTSALLQLSRRNRTFRSFASGTAPTRHLASTTPSHCRQVVMFPGRNSQCCSAPPLCTCLGTPVEKIMHTPHNVRSANPRVHKRQPMAFIHSGCLTVSVSSKKEAQLAAASSAKLNIGCRSFLKSHAVAQGLFIMQSPPPHLQHTCAL